MKYITSFLIPLALLAASLNAAPTTEEEKKIRVTREFYADEMVVHTADHEIVDLFMPLNQINFEDDPDVDIKHAPVLFYALADINDKGEKTDRGYYKLENNVAYKLIDNGRDATADIGDGKVIYIAAADGIYVYDQVQNSTKKYGTITDNIVKLLKFNNTDLFYMLTADNKVYKVTNEGTKKEEVKELDGVTDMALDKENEFYFVKDSKLFAYDNGVTEIPVPEGEKKLIKPPFLQEEGILCVVGNDLYIGYKNGTFENTEFVVLVKPSAYAPEFALIHYYGFEKKIYEVNVLGLVLTTMSDELKTVLGGFKDELDDLSNALIPIKSL